MLRVAELALAALVLCAPLARAQAADPTREALTSFRRELDRFRRNEDGALALVRDLAASLARDHRRPDAADVVAYYAALTPEARERGLADEAEFNAAWTRVNQAASARLQPAEWREEREEILADLRAVVERAEDGGDWVPAARARSLIARLALQRAREDDEMTTEAREKLCAEARELATLSLEALERAEFVTPRLEPLWILGSLALLDRDFDRAEDEFDECRARARAVGNVDYEVRALEGLHDVAVQLGDLHGVQRVLQSLAQVVPPAQSWSLARRYADYLLMSDEPARAVEFLARHQPEDQNDAAEWRVLRGSALLRLGDEAAALAEYAEVADTAPAGQAFDAEIGRAAIAVRAGDPARALELLDPDDDARREPRPRSVALWVRGEALLASGDVAGAIAAFESSIEIFDSFESRLARDGRRVSVLGELVGLETIANLALARAQGGDALGAALTIEDFQSRRLRGAVRLTADDLRAWAAASELGFVTWIVGADTAVFAHVARDGVASAAAIPHGRRTLESAVRRVREAAIAGDEASARRLASEIEAAIFPRAFLDALPRGFSADGARLLCLLHGPLERLPLDLLPLFAGANDRHLVPLALPGLSAARPGTGPATRDLGPWSVLGAPLDRDGRTELAGAAEEIDDVAALHARSTRIVGSAFDRAALEAALRSGRPLHVATHVRRDPGSSAFELGDPGLVLSADGFFTPRDVLAVSPKLPIAVLSACESGEGARVDAHGLDGLARAFLESGTRDVIVTLWPIDDRYARTWAQALHRALLRGDSPARAAAAARNALKAEGAPVSEWAAYRCLGRE